MKNHRLNNSTKYKQAGIGLIEIMITMALSLLLLGGVIQIFSSSKASYQMQEGISRLQENSRFAVELLRRHVRLSGYSGCTNPGLVAPRNIATGAPPEITFNAADVLSGTDNTQVDGVLSGTDTLIIRYGSPNAVPLSANMLTDTSHLMIASNPDNMVTGDFILVTDCERADLFKATSIITDATGMVTIEHDNTGNISNNLSKAYRDDAQVMRLNFSTYFINDSGRTNDDGKEIYSLWETTQSTTHELVEGIEDMQIIYGVDTNILPDGTIDIFQTATAVTNSASWDKVVSVRIALLASTTEDISSKQEPYIDLQGDLQAYPDDHRIRRQFVTTVGLRNRVP